MAAVSLKDVRKSYTPELQVIHGVNMEIADGEFIVILGPSGCGKSTLLRMVAGLETITAGETLREHQAVLSAIVARKPAAARLAMRHHMDMTRKRYIKDFKVAVN